MHNRADAIVAAARTCVGTRFRPQGRLPGTGLDCVGVALVAARAAGVTIDPPAYAIGGDREAELDTWFALAGCTSVAADLTMPGDLLVVAPAPARRHLAVVTPRGIIHAHAGLRRVVEGPVDPGWTLIAAWRLPQEA